MPTIGAVIAASVRAERAFHGWSQRELADRLGWSTGMVSDLETGQRKVLADDLPQLCAAFGITLGQLVARAEADDVRALGL